MSLAAEAQHSGLTYFACILSAILQEGDRVVMVQEWADGGDLFNLLQKYGGCLSERVAVQMVLDPFLRVLQVRLFSGWPHNSYTCTQPP
jgi:hypothetical protein